MRNKRPSENLDEIDAKDHQFNIGYLIKHNLLAGHTSCGDNGVAHYSSRDITGTGMDIVEKLIDQSVFDFNKSGGKDIDYDIPYVKKIEELNIVWSDNSQLFHIGLELLATLMRALIGVSHLELEVMYWYPILPQH